MTSIGEGKNKSRPHPGCGGARGRDCRRGRPGRSQRSPRDRRNRAPRHPGAHRHALACGPEPVQTSRFDGRPTSLPKASPPSCSGRMGGIRPALGRRDRRIRVRRNRAQHVTQPPTKSRSWRPRSARAWRPEPGDWAPGPSPGSFSTTGREPGGRAGRSQVAGRQRRPLLKLQGEPAPLSRRPCTPPRNGHGHRVHPRPPGTARPWSTEANSPELSSGGCGGTRCADGRRCSPNPARVV